MIKILFLVREFSDIDYNDKYIYYYNLSLIDICFRDDILISKVYHNALSEMQKTLVYYLKDEEKW